MLVKDKGSDIAILRTMGGLAGIDHAGVPDHGRFDRRRPAPLTGLFVGMLICLNIESIRQFLSWLTSTELFSPELYFSPSLPAEIDFGETSAVVIMALTRCPSSPRSIRHGVPPASIPSTRSGTSEGEDGAGGGRRTGVYLPRDKARHTRKGRRH